MSFFHATGTITGGSIDNTPIGSSTPSSGIFTNVDVESQLSLQGGGFPGFYYHIVTDALVADRNAVLPLLTVDDTFLFENHTQTLTNKTIVDSSNDVAASRLLHTSGNTVISGSSAPSYDQTLRANAGGATAEWRHDEIRRSVRVATTTAGSLISDFDNGSIVDGVVLSTNDRILIKNQASGVENGIYVVQATGAPIRAEDFASGSSVASSIVFVRNGTVNADRGFLCTNNTGTDTVGSDALSWQSFTATPAELQHPITVPLLTLQAAASGSDWGTIAYFPWDQSRHGSYTSGTIVFRAEVGGTRTLSIRLYDVTNATVLGSLSGIASTSAQTFAVTNPLSASAEVVLQISRSPTGTTPNPSVKGVLLEYIA